MEDFYRWQRRRLGYLMDGDEPAGGVWNLDAENREPPPKDAMLADSPQMAYINRMSDHCRGCHFNPKARTGDDACPYTRLYWDFLARHRGRLSDNHRMAQALAGLDRLSDLDEVRVRAAAVREALATGTL